MKKLAIVLLLLGAEFVSAQQMSPHEITSCRQWNTFSRDHRIGWAIGYHDGLTVGLDVGKLSEKQASDFFEASIPDGMSYSEIATALDNFCKTPEYATISLLSAGVVVAMKHRGAKQSDIDDLVATILAGKASGKQR